jgi:RND family efflux transporter MFP subunit
MTPDSPIRTLHSFVRITRTTSGPPDMTQRASSRSLPAAMPRGPIPFRAHIVALVSVVALAACGGADKDVAHAADATPARVAGTTLRVADTLMMATFDASGVAEPMQQATLSTKLMGTVTAVLVHEGDVVQDGQPLLRLDAREITAKASQIAASIADAEALQKDAASHAGRFRALYADSAATKAQFDAAETGLARADAGLRAAHAAASELDAMSSYATVRSPFAGVIAKRLADPGTFAAPGAPLLMVQDIRTLRVSVSAAADAVRGIARGLALDATIDGEPATATVEGVVPAGAGNLFTVNATVANPKAHFRAGSSAVLHLPSGLRHALLVPLGAIVRDGDLTGVIVHGAQRDERRWVRLGAQSATHVDVTSGLAVGDEIVLPTPASSSRTPTPRRN